MILNKQYLLKNCQDISIKSHSASICLLLIELNYKMAARLPTHVQYRNATYYGAMEQYQRHGHGLLVLDNSQILLAQWRRNAIHGKYVFISDNIRAYGSMIAGRLDGYNILWTKASKAQNRNEKTLYGMFREDKLYGKVVTVENGQVLVSQFANSELKEVISRSPVRDRQVFDALTQHFPKSMYTLQEFLISFMKDAESASQSEEQVPRYRPVVIPIKEDRFFGYEECFNKGRRYGFILQQNKVLSVGEHIGALLEGIGRFYAQDCIEDGIFKEGHLKGIGIKYYHQGNKYTLGEHDGKSALQKGFGFPNRQVCEIRKQFHLRSIYFYNDIVMLGLTAHFTGLLSSLMLEGRPKRNESPKFNQDRTPNRTALYKYEQQPDEIEDSSPIKDKFSEYRPVDKKTNKYFTLDQEEEEYDRRRQREKSIGNNNNPYYRQSRNIVEKEPTPTNSRMNDRNEPPLNSRNRGGAMETRGGATETRERSASRNNGRSGVKDTKQFVRELQQQQKRKRLDLDKIYRQAGLYRKK